MSQHLWLYMIFKWYASTFFVFSKKHFILCDCRILSTSFLFEPYIEYWTKLLHMIYCHQTQRKHYVSRSTKLNPPELPLRRVLLASCHRDYCPAIWCSRLARESWRGIRVSFSWHNTSPNPCASSRSVYQMEDWHPPLILICYSPPIKAGVISHLI